MQSKIIGLVLLLASFVWSVSLAQLKTDKCFYNWYYGHYIGLNFNTIDGKPDSIRVSSMHMSSLEEAMSMSDKNGNLLFYYFHYQNAQGGNHDVMSIYNNKNQEMPNSSLDKPIEDNGIFSLISLRLPNSDSLYYFFYSVFSKVSNEVQLRYGIIDMSLDGGKGDVIQKHLVLSDSIGATQIRATKHSNGRDFWLIATNQNNNTILAFLIDSSGISKTPVISKIKLYDNHQRSNPKVSPDCKTIALVYWAKCILLLNFDNSTGKATYKREINRPNPWSLEFSPNCNLLYVRYESGLYQFNLEEPDSIAILRNSIRFAGESNYNYPDMQLGPDGKIYSAYYKFYFIGNSNNFITYTDVVNQPNNIGKACNYDTFALRLPDSTWGRVLPFSMPEYISTDLKIARNSVCEGDTLFLKGIFQDGAKYEWSGPDGFIDSTQNPVIPNVSQKNSGLYRVIARYGYAYRVAEDSIFINPVPKPEIAGVFEICQGDSTVLRTTKPYTNYEWSTGSKEDNIFVKAPGNYSVTVTNEYGCKGSITFEVVVLTTPRPKISGPNSVCLNSEKEYTISYNKDSKKDWVVFGCNLISGSGSNTIKVRWGTKGTGRIIVTQTDTTTGCKGSDTLDIIINDTLKPNLTATNTKLCKGGFVTISAPIGYSKYKWNTGDTTREITVTKEGEYYVWVQDAGDCAGTSDKIIISEAPLPTPVIVGDSLLCQGTGNLSVQQDFVSYLWNNGETTKQINITQPGNYSVEVVDTNGCIGTTDFTVKEFQFKLSGITDLDFGKTKVGTPVSKKLKLKNEFNSEIRISKVSTKSNSPEFKIITNPVIPATLKINETIEIEISFIPKESKQYQDSLVVESDSPCMNSISSLLKGEAGVKTLVWLPDTSGKVGETDFCILLRSNFVEPYTQKLSYSATIRFDASAFLPDSIYKSYILGTDRFVEMRDSNISLSENETKLGEFCGTILLANNDRTPLYIDVFEWTDSSIETEKKDGSLTLMGLCVRNLSRLKLLITDEITLSPNPAEDFIEISVGAQGTVPNIRIYNVFGETIKNPTPTLPEGEGVRIDVSGLPSGVYFVRVGDKVGKFVKI